MSSGSHRSGRLLPPPGPGRLLLQLSLVNSTGNGVFYTLGVLYFTRILGFAVLHVAVGLAVAGVAGVLAGVPVGHLADRRGAREVMALMFAASAVCGGLLLVLDTYWQFVVVFSLFSFCTNGAGAVRSALLGTVATGAARTDLRARVRAVTNVVGGIGAVVAILALHADSRPAYQTVMLLDVISYVVCVLLTLRLPRTQVEVGEEFPHLLGAVRDLPFLSLTMVSAVMALNFEIVDIAMPLWVVDHTEAPRWTVSLLAVLNTAVVVVAQVAVSKRVHTIRAGAVAGVFSGGMLFLCCVAFGASGGTSMAAAFVMLVIAILLQVGGELLQSAASFVLGYDLARQDAMGQYQGLFSSGQTLAVVVGAPVMALLPLGMGVAGWWVLGAILLGAGALTVPVVAWAQRTREQPAAA